MSATLLQFTATLSSSSILLSYYSAEFGATLVLSKVLIHSPPFLNLYFT